MDRLLYNATIGASHVERAQAVHANNLANVGTTGFRADFAQAQSHWAEGDGFPVRVYGITEMPGTDFRPGVLTQTGRDLDVAVQGEGFLAVQLEDGSEAYTRAGDLTLDAFGRLLSRDGLPVLGDQGPISVPPYETLFFGTDGSVSVRLEGQGPETVSQIGRLKLVNPNPADLIKDEAGRIRLADGAPAVADPGVKIRGGFLESSNVSAVSELTEILALARQFEVEVRLMRTAEENDQAAASLVQIG